MKNTRLHKAFVFLWIFFSLILLSWKAINNYKSESLFFYLFFAILFLHTGYGAFKFVDLFKISFKIIDIILNLLTIVIIIAIAFFYPFLALQFLLVSIFFVLVILNYYLASKKTRNNAYKKYAFEKIKLESWAILLFFIITMLIFYFSFLNLAVGIILFFGQLIIIIWMVFYKRIYAVKP